MKTFTQVIQSAPFIRSQKSNHGEYCVFVCGELLLIFPKGTWGSGCVRNYIEAMESIFAESQFQQFGGIICLDSWSLGTPEVLKKLSQYSQKSSARGSIAQWLIGASTSDIAMQVADAKIVNDNKLSYTSNDIETAITDLLERGLTFDSEEVRTLYLNRDKIWSISPTR